LREKLEAKSGEELYKELQELDPDYALELHPNNKQYVIRALEVYMLTGKSKREFREEKDLRYDVLFLTPDYGSREELYSRINIRVDQMFQE
jgi:tRNA dimethylallyltransferase